jgi:hypothetical protein
VVLSLTLLSLLLLLLQGLDAATSSLSAELRQLQASIKAEQEGLADFREVSGRQKHLNIYHVSCFTFSRSRFTSNERTAPAFHAYTSFCGVVDVLMCSGCTWNVLLAAECAPGARQVEECRK